MYVLTNVKIVAINGGVTAEITYQKGEDDPIVDTVNYQGGEMPKDNGPILAEWVKERAIAHVEGKNIEHDALPSDVAALIGNDIPLD